MPVYSYKAYNKENKIVYGEYETLSKEEVVNYLTAHFLTAVSIKSNVAESKGKKILSFQLFGGISTVDIMFLVRNLATTIKAGLSVAESLEILIDDAENKTMKKILGKALVVIKNGQPLSEGFDAYKDSFPPIFIGMIKAGEVSGQLEKTLPELSSYLSKEYALRNKIKSALTYPVILLIASTAMVILMLIFVIPRLAQSFTSSGVQLPLITKVLLLVSAALTWSYTLDIAVIIFIIWFFTFFRRTQFGKKLFFFILSHTPVASELIKKIALVRFSRTAGNLVGGGMSVVDSLMISAESIDNQTYTYAISRIVDDIKNGIPVSDSIGKYPKLFPKLLISLIVVGERTGSLHEILITFADFYEEEVDNKLKDLTAILEPVLLLFMGLLIGAIAISIILPIYQLVGHFV